MDNFDYSESPCNGNCHMDDNGTCSSCLRLRYEILNWWDLSLEKKKEIWGRLGITDNNT